MTTEKKTLKELREERRWSQNDLAGRVGCTLFSIHHWENGHRPPADYMYRRLLKVLGVTPDEIDLVPYEPSSRRPRKRKAVAQ